MLVRQIAGLIARRIITDSKVGDRVQQGDRMGLIRFGSRVDVSCRSARSSREGRRRGVRRRDGHRGAEASHEELTERARTGRLPAGKASDAPWC